MNLLHTSAPQNIPPDFLAHDFEQQFYHDGVINKWEPFPRYWPFVWGIHRSPVNFPHKGQ